MKICINCGKELPEEALYCNKCGSKQEEFTNEPESKENIEENKPNPSMAKRKDLSVIFILLFAFFSFFIIHSVYTHTKYKNEILIRKYINSVNYEKNLTQSSSDNSNNIKKEEELRNDIEYYCNEYNKNLPENLGLGMTMKRCELIGYYIEFTIEWKGVKASDFDDESKSEIKSSMKEGLYEETSESFLKRLKDNYYNLRYNIINEKGQEVFEVCFLYDEI